MTNTDLAQKKKDAFYWKTLNKAIELDFKKGHLKWSMSDLSRSSGVTRSLIYYYFGRSRMDIINEAVKLIGDDLLGLNSERIKLVQEKGMTCSILQSKEKLMMSPHLLSFYAHHRIRNTEIGKTLLNYEDSYFKKIKTLFPQKSFEEIELTWGIIFGLTVCPRIPLETIKKFEKTINQLLSQGL